MRQMKKIYLLFIETSNSDISHDVDIIAGKFFLSKNLLAPNRVSYTAFLKP